MSTGAIFVQTERVMTRMELDAYDRESDFQRLLEEYPELLAGEQIDAREPRRWLLVASEVGIPAETEGSNYFSLDHLFIDQDAIPTLVEVKRQSDSRLRREVVGQMLDYAANAVIYWPEGSLQERFLASCAARGEEPDEKLAAFLQDAGMDSELFWQRVHANLREGRIRLIFAADRIPPELLRVIEFLNERMDPTEVLGLEIRRYKGGSMSTHVPRILGQTSDAQVAKRSRPSTSRRRKWDEQSFRDEVARNLSDENLNAVLRVVGFAVQEAPPWWGEGVQRGSVTPKFPEIGNIGPVTVYTDGQLEVKLEYLNGTPEMESLRERAREEFRSIGLPTGEGLRSAPKMTVTEWAPKVGELLEALRTARRTIESKDGPAVYASSPSAPAAVPLSGAGDEYDHVSACTPGICPA